MIMLHRFEIFQAILVFIFLCLTSTAIIWDKEKEELNLFNKFSTKEKFEPQKSC